MILQVTQAAGGAQEVQAGDILLVDGEQMLVTGVASGGANLYNLTVARLTTARPRPRTAPRPPSITSSPTRRSR